ncbi:NAD(P)H-binding protein [Agrococcus sp. ARC_14]|uniref:NAD(P)-dependent oxidoreductase n=1 Tax=Agrococcus sp. ARC_14 TaxID=2919927 RepID=UPI001F056856|nr:NAD(P)H-binding protein [Agrococcus sp. ARC_14]
MRITIFGASGRTGRLIVRQALDRGHDVTAVVRQPVRFDPARANLRVEVGDLNDPTTLEPSISGADAVVSALGPTGRDRTAAICAPATRSILRTMADTGVMRVVALSAQPVLRGASGEPWWFRASVLPLVRVVYRNVYADLGEMEQTLARSDRDWTVLRPPALTDGPGLGSYRMREAANVRSMRMARGDLARAALDVIDDVDTRRRAFGVG